MIEFIGILAGIMLFISLISPCTSIKANIIMRSLNAAGSALFVLYGFLIPAYSTAILNISMIFLNIFNLIKLIREIKRD